VLVNVSLQVIPINTSDAYPIIDQAIELIQASGLRYEVQAFGTIMEGEYDDIMEVIKQIRKRLYQTVGEEFIFNIQVHMKKNVDVSFEEKTKGFNS